MKLTHVLIVTIGLIVLGTAPNVASDDDKVECVADAADGAPCVRFWAIPDVPEGQMVGPAANFHQFYSAPGSSCTYSPVIPFTVCAEGHANMAFSSGCPGTGGTNQICLQVTGGGSGSAVLSAGEVTSGVSHMTQEDCGWTSILGGSCSVTFHDPTTGSTVHKHWHDMINTWQCHDGSTTTTTSPLGGRVTVYFQACYRYGPL
jgi:hypothetical protein